MHVTHLRKKFFFIFLFGVWMDNPIPSSLYPNNPIDLHVDPLVPHQLPPIKCAASNSCYIRRSTIWTFKVTSSKAFNLWIQQWIDNSLIVLYKVGDHELHVQIVILVAIS